MNLNNQSSPADVLYLMILIILLILAFPIVLIKSIIDLLAQAIHWLFVKISAVIGKVYLRLGR